VSRARTGDEFEWEEGWGKEYSFESAAHLHLSLDTLISSVYMRVRVCVRVYSFCPCLCQYMDECVCMCACWYVLVRVGTF
jgi:hypothetical protein